MSDKFSEMASRVGAEHRHKQEMEKKSHDAEQAAKDARVDADIAALERYVHPVVEAARSAFETQGIVFVIEKHYDVRNRAVYVAPSISFRGQTPARKGDGYRSDTRRVFFVSTDGKLAAKSSKEGFSREGDDKELGRGPIEGSEKLVTDAIEWALNAYHEDLKNCMWLRMEK